MFVPKALTSPDAEDPIGLRPISVCNTKSIFLRILEAPASPMQFGALVPRGSNGGLAISPLFGHNSAKSDLTVVCECPKQTFLKTQWTERPVLSLWRTCPTGPL